MAREPYLNTLRELVRCYQTWETFSAAHLRTLGLTPPQFDIIATLGNTPGMSCKELGEKTLTTKGTLTGILDRLEEKGLVRRVNSPTDRRSFRVELTPAGDALFQQVFPTHIAHGKRAFSQLDQTELERLAASLARLRQAFITATEEKS